MKHGVTNLNSPRESMETGVADLEETPEPIRFDVMAAMCDGSRGIGYRQQLPWPYLRNDYEFYSKMTSTRKDTQSDKKILHIRGRTTWESTPEKERNLPNVLHIIVSNTMKECNHPKVVKIVRSFTEAVDFYMVTYRHNVDSVWVMGGATIYQEAMKHPYCRHLYITHVYAEYPCDVFFPPFEESYVDICDPRVDGTLQEDSGVQYQFKVYQRNRELT